MSDFFKEVFSALENTVFEEIPVDARTFVEGEDYLNQPPLSDIQYVIVECMSQIYRKEELMYLLGDDEGEEHYRKYTKNELILALGKGCHAPYTPIFDPATGKWTELSKLGEGNVATMSGNQYSTESFLEGRGEMVRVKTSLGFIEDVYVGHKYFVKNNGFKEVSGLTTNDYIAIGLNMKPENPINVSHDYAQRVGQWLRYGNKMQDYQEFLDNYGPVSRNNIPDEIWLSDNTILKIMLDKLCPNSIDTNPELAKDIHRAFLRLGIMSKLDGNNVYRVDNVDGNIYWDRIVSIEPISDGEYWTRTVPDAGHYIGNGLISANSGKDYTSTIGVAYIVYKLLCLNDPARYYGKPSGDAIDIMNVAINAQQAKNVFFKGFKSKIEKSPWFRNKFSPRMDYIEFDKSITVYSGHSERESHEGLNLFCAILDEISGFAVESTTGHAFAKTADAIYKAFRGTVDSRFPDMGKVVLLSFPRFKEDYISKKYDDAIANKETEVKSYKFKLDDELPDGIDGNEFTIEWDEDHIISYSLPGVFALKRPTWDVNPTRKIDDFKHAFYTDPQDALQRFACMPPEAESGYFTDHEKIRDSFSVEPVIVEGSSFAQWFRPDPDKQYYMHVDLAQKHDRCALAVSHVESWSQVAYVMNEDYYSPHIVVDFVYWWTPNKNQSVNFTEVKEFIIDFYRRGFNLQLVTFDRWQSHDMIQELRAVGINSDVLSVAKQHYDDFKLSLMESRVSGPDIDILKKELMQLRLIKNKVDHPRAGGKDLADAVCGSIYNAMTLTPPEESQNIRVLDLNDMKKTPQQPLLKDAIAAPKREMPQELADFISGMKAI